jgi:HD-GYP domain-containing protein (c-di-GMP phosphodiesterase class II)/putative Ca2+/H+ antiporter (TMEM165/GDT1 family)
MSLFSEHNRRCIAEFALALSATVAIVSLVIADGRIPSVFTTLFFAPVIFLAYRHSLPYSLVVAIIASLATSPAMGVFNVEMNDSVMPVLWLGWPAVYFFLAVTLNQWTNIKTQRDQLDETVEHLLEVQAHNDRRQQELETLSVIHSTIMAGHDEASVLGEITRRVAELTGAKLCSLVVADPGDGERPYASYGFDKEDFAQVFAGGAPYGEGVSGWCILHRRIATSSDVFHDPRYDGLRQFALATGYRAAAAAPLEFDEDIMAALVICYEEERQFAPEELTRLERLARQTELAIRSVRQQESLSRFAFDTALALTEAIESRDPYTGGHCHRLAEHAGRTAQQLLLPPREIEIVRMGAALHDVGKIIVPDAILKKPDKLTPDEFVIVKQHCYSGGQICKRVPFLRDVYPIVYHHHERWDGQGYPDGLYGERIPQGARIVAVADAYDSMTSDRPYRKAMSHEQASDILKDGAGRQWDATVVRIFLERVQVKDAPEREQIPEPTA